MFRNRRDLMLLALCTMKENSHSWLVLDGSSASTSIVEMIEQSVTSA